MRKKIAVTFFLFFFLLTPTSHAQTFVDTVASLPFEPSYVTGRVLDEKGEALPFATISLFSLPDSTLLAGGISDAEGQFQLAASCEKCYLQITYLGYEMQRVAVVDGQAITLKPSAVRIDEVSVRAVRPKVLFKGDRFAVSIEHSMLAEGSSMEGLLQHMPGVWAGRNGITVNGQKAQLMIDDQMLTLSDDALMAHLQTLRSEDISTVEIIPNPPAIYDAEGGSIIRILTKKRVQIGFSTTASATALYRDFFGIRPYLRFQYNRNKLTATLSLSGERSRWLGFSDRYSEELSHHISYTTMRSTDTMSDLNYSANLWLGYKFNSSNSLLIRGNYTHWGKMERLRSITDISGETVAGIRSSALEQLDDQAMQCYGVTLNYNVTFDSLQRKKLVVLADFVNQFAYPYSSELHYLNRDVAGVLLLEEYNRYTQEKPYRILSGEVRYSHDAEAYGALTTGVKYSHANVFNALRGYEKVRDEWLLDSQLGYDMLYTEQIAAVYASYGVERPQWGGDAGLRGEYTLPNDSKAKGYACLFPSANLTYRPHKSHSLGVNYTMRISRVPYFQLQPSRYFSSRYEIMEGNPNLRPNLIHRIGLNYSFKDRYYLSLSYSLNGNARSRYQQSEMIDATMVVVRTYKDGIQAQNFNANVYIPIDFFSWWSCINQLNFYYYTYRLPDLQPFSSATYDALTRHTFVFPKDFTFELLYRYVSPTTDGYTKYNAQHILTCGMKKYFLNRALFLKLDVSGILSWQRNGFVTKTPTVYNRIEMYGTRRPLFSFTISYSFRPSESRPVYYEVSNDEEQARTY